MIKYGNQHVDERYSSIFEPNLFTNAWLVPGVTCTNKYMEGPAGSIYVHKLKNVAAVSPTLPGSKDFNHEETEDDLIQISINNNYMRSKKIRQVQANAVSANLANENLSTATQEVREGREYSVHACLITEGTASANTTALTKENIKEEILKERAALVKGKGKANVVLCSPDTYSLLLTVAGAEFTPVRNERIQYDGQIGQWLGMVFIEDNQLASGSAIEYNDYTGAKKTVTAATLGLVDFIMYYSETLSVIDNLNALRIIDAIDFVGSLAQTEVNTGMRVTNSALVRVRKHAA